MGDTGEAQAHHGSAGTVVTETLQTDTPYVRWVKPALDRLGGIVLSVLTLPLVVIIVVAIWSTMGRKAIFVQERVGRNGRVFRVYKFRTMAHDRRTRADGYDGPDRRINHKDPNDPRHTRLGRFLRKWSLDEIPQFWNVAKGDMSLVGPRPELVSVVERYEPWQHARHYVKPGITGLWQISERGDVPMHEATETDLEYLDKVSLATDLKVLAMTVPAALGRRTGH